MLLNCQPPAWLSFSKLGLAFLLASGLTVGADQVHARRTESEAGVVGTVKRAELPPEAQTTERLIRSGGPFPHAKDGVVFGNRERHLPSERRGFYREYTVATPGARNRGARRIVCGGQVPTAPQACYFTVDHYNTFRRIAP